MRAAGVVPGTVGSALLVCAARASPLWLQRHVFQPGYFVPPGASAAWVVRGLLVLLGAALLFIALRLRSWGALVRSAAALLLALLAVEGALRLVEKPETQSRNPRLEARLGQPDAQLGWTLTPSRTSEVQVWRGERRVRYAVDAHGDRAPAQDFAEDPAAPTVIVTGESIAFGHALDWTEALPGLLQRELGMQIIDVDVGGYGSDQAYQRLASALPRFRNLVATVTLVVPVQLGRNVQSYRPRLALQEGALRLRAGAPSRLRLGRLFLDELPLLAGGRLEESLRLTRALFQRTAQLGPALFVLVDLGEPHGATDWLAESLLTGLRFVRVELRRDQLLADGHPDAAATFQIARAVAAELRRGR